MASVAAELSCQAKACRERPLCSHPDADRLGPSFQYFVQGVVTTRLVTLLDGSVTLSPVLLGVAVIG